MRLLRHETCDEDATLELYVVEGGGHVWPGAPGATQEISATDLMWDFFQAHPLDVEKPVGGIARPSEAAGRALGAGANSGSNYGLFAAVSAAVAAGLALLGGAAGYARRRSRT